MTKKNSRKNFVSTLTRLARREAVDWNKNKELSNCAKRGDAQQLRQLLLNCTARDINALDKIKFKAPLHYAVITNSVECCQLLLDAKANISLQTRTTPSEGITAIHQTPLHLACKRGTLQMTKYLFSHGADVYSEVVNFYRQTPMNLAVETENFEAAALLLCLNSQKLQTKTLILINFRLKYNSPIFSEISTYSHLTELNLSTNHLARIPKELLELKQLVTLDLSYNYLTEINPNIYRLESLNNLLLQSNRLELPPIPLTTLKNLINLQIGGTNPLTYIPDSVLGDRKSPALEQRVIAYLKQFKSSPVSWKKLKLIIVGQENVGKTTLLNNLRGDGSQYSIERNISTNGISITDLEISKTLSITAWDFGGQEVFYPTHQFFLTGRAIYILACSAADLSTFERVNYWMQQVQLVSLLGRSYIIVVVTHMDHHSVDEARISEILKRVDQLGDKVSGRAFVSNKTGDNFPKLRQLIEEVGLKHSYCGKQVPATWELLHNKCQVLLRVHQIDTIEWKNMKTVAHDCGIEEKDIMQALEFLKDVGSLVYYITDTKKHHPDFVIIDPSWLANVMSSVITFRHSWVRDGILLHSDFPHVWESYSTAMYENLIQLLEKFEISYRMAGNPPRSLIPSLLNPRQPSDTLASIWPTECPTEFDQFMRKFKFKFLPMGLFERLLVRVLHIPNTQSSLIWKTGIVLALLDELALITFDPLANELVINIRIPKGRATKLLRATVNDVETLVEAFYFAPEQTSITIPCHHCISSHIPNPYEFPRVDCIRALTSGQAFVYCKHQPTGNVPVRIDVLAPDLTFTDVALLENVVIEKKLAQGGFGIVYKGTYNGDVVAIKELSKKNEGEITTEMFDEFMREVYVMSCLTHPNLVQLFGITVNPLQMIMEFLPSGDLYHLLHSDKPMSYFFQLRIALDIAMGMEYLQSVQPPIIHRDLRSPNVLMVSYDENDPVIAKVADFGLARSVAPKIAGALGTWQWHSPEVLNLSSVYYDERADTYSFAIVLWEVFTRGYPFDEYAENTQYARCVGKKQGNDVWIFRQIEVKHAIVNDNLRPTLPESMDPRLKQLISSCWDTDREKRPKFGNIVANLLKLVKEQGSYEPVFIEPVKKLEPQMRVTPATSSSPLNLQYCQEFKISGRPISMHCSNDKVWIGCSDGNIFIHHATGDFSLVSSHHPHDTRIYSIISTNNEIWTTSEIGSFFIYSESSASLIEEVKSAHGNSMIRALLLYKLNGEEVLWSICPPEREIAVWDPKKREKLYNFSVQCIPNSIYLTEENKIWIGGFKNIEIFNIDYENKMLVPHKILEGQHTRKITHLVGNRNELWSCSDDGNIFIWNIFVESLVRELHLNTPALFIKLVGDNIWSGNGKTITRWSKSRYTPMDEIPTSDIVGSMTFVNSSVWVGTVDSKVVIIPLKS